MHIEIVCCTNRKSYFSTFHKTNKIHVYDLTKYNNEAIDLEKITLKFESAICILVIYVHYIIVTATFDFFYLI